MSFFFTPSNEETVTAEESLLVVAQESCSNNNGRHPHHYRFGSRNEEDRCCMTTRQQALMSTSSESSSTSCFLYYIRPRFILAGFLFGALTEMTYNASITLGYATLEQKASTTTEADHYSVHMDTWTDVFFYELSFLYADVLFLLYLIILTRSVIHKSLSMSLPIKAANWTVGMVWGLSAAVASLVGPKVLLQERIYQVLGCMVVGIALCFVTYSMAVEIQVYRTSNFEMSSSSSCPPSSSLASCEEGKNSKVEQRRKGDLGAATCTSMVDARVV